jgi:hypothetical protein
MKRLFDSILNSAIKRVINSPDPTLFSEKFEESVFKEFKIDLPRLEKDKVKIKIGEEIIGFGNAPEGISFVPGHPMEYALFLTPMSGSKDFFKIIINPFFSDRKTGFDGNNLIYKEITGRKITGDDTEIQKIRENAKNKIAFIESRLNSFEMDVNSFYENSLKPTIKQAIDNERRKRKSKSDAVSKLNPFS